LVGVALFEPQSLLVNLRARLLVREVCTKPRVMLVMVLLSQCWQWREVAVESC
jgi:hypothetical protein